MPIFTSMGAGYGFGRANKSITTVEFNYPDFSSTTGLTQVSTAGVISNALYLSQATYTDVGNV